MKLTLDILDHLYPRTLDAVAANHPDLYPLIVSQEQRAKDADGKPLTDEAGKPVMETVQIPNPQSKEEFLVDFLLNTVLRGNVSSYEERKEIEKARKAHKEKIDRDFEKVK